MNIVPYDWVKPEICAKVRSEVWEQNQEKWNRTSIFLKPFLYLRIEEEIRIELSKYRSRKPPHAV